MAIIDWLREKLPSKKGQPLMIFWSWKCDPEIWLTNLVKKLIEKVKK